MIDKYGEEVLRELEEEKQNKKKKEAAVPEIQNINQTVAFASKLNSTKRYAGVAHYSETVIRVSNGFEMILCIKKFKKKFIIFAFKKLITHLRNI